MNIATDIRPSIEGEVIPPDRAGLPGTTLETLKPLVLLETPATFEGWFALLAAEVKAEAAQTDFTTEAGQEKIRALSYRVARLKTAIHDEAMSITEVWRKSTKAVTAQRVVIVDRMAALQAEVKASMDAWIEAEKVRATKVAEVLQRLETAAEFPIGTTAAAMQERIARLSLFPISEEEFRGDYHKAVALRDAALPKIKALIAAAAKAEAETAELAALRAEMARRNAADAAAELQRQQQARAALAEEAARLKAEENRHAADAAAEAAREKAVQDGLNAAAAAEAADAARLAAAEARRAEEAQQADAAAARAERTRLQRQVRQAEMRAALIREGEITEAQADMIILAMITGEIPHVTVDL